MPLFICINILLSSANSFCLHTSSMEEYRRGQIPAFGNWDGGESLPITQYFESAREAGLLRRHAEENMSGFRQTIKSGEVMQKPRTKPHQHTKDQKKKVGVRVCSVSEPMPRKPAVTPKPVDEDLYKIPPELLRRSRRNKFMDLLSGMCGCQKI
ncbi:uncharacterized protein LOC18434972 isoform X3 [Amborella trichopoda]|uniref:uncharacterized protein LOC18434972 isoform X3 n=1 Tax=Amborella trichopoda TaxID=13333 RepID=UPI0005D3A360|nr:uncharacterized protein LOC18434972 isoform X3 [Amborella trichopoda]|eukprot:XP_011623687.1 uncharacterized protein LOC18434972 isoform X3 [Amborella trichopoda]